MAWHEIPAGDGVHWRVDLEALMRACNRTAYLEAFDADARLVRTEDHWMQKVGLAPDNAQIDWDVDRVAADKARRYHALYTGFFEKLAASGGAAFAHLIEIRRRAEALVIARDLLFAKAQSINRGNVEWAETGIKRARFVRDASVTVIGVTAAVASGGTTTFAVGAALSVGGKAGTTYQDAEGGGLERARKAVLAGSFEALSLGVGPLLKGATAMRGAGAVASRIGASADEVAVAGTLLIGSGVEFASELTVKDKEMDEALIAALLTLGFGAASESVGKQVQRHMHHGIDKVRKVLGTNVAITNADRLFGRGVGPLRPEGDRTAAVLYEGLLNAAKGQAGDALAPAPAAPAAGPKAAAASAPDSAAAARWAIDHVMRPA